MSRDHRKLKAFELADELVTAIYEVTRSFPKDEWFGLRAQMRRAATSVPANIVEGAARRNEAEYLHFLNIAFGSLRELGYYITLAARLGYIASDEHTERLVDRQAEAARVLAALMRSLTSSDAMPDPRRKRPRTSTA